MRFSGNNCGARSGRPPAATRPGRGHWLQKLPSRSAVKSAAAAAAQPRPTCCCCGCASPAHLDGGGPAVVSSTAYDSTDAHTARPAAFRASTRFLRVGHVLPATTPVRPRAAAGAEQQAQNAQREVGGAEQQAGHAECRLQARSSKHGALSARLGGSTRFPDKVFGSGRSGGGTARPAGGRRPCQHPLPGRAAGQPGAHPSAREGCAQGAATRAGPRRRQSHPPPRLHPFQGLARGQWRRRKHACPATAHPHLPLPLHQ